LIDESCKGLGDLAFDHVVKKSTLAWYSEKRAIRQSLCTLMSIHRPQGPVLLFCDADDGALTKLTLKEHGIEARLAASVFCEDVTIKQEQTTLREVDAIVSFGGAFTDGLNGDHVRHLKKWTRIYALRPHAFSKSFWENAVAAGLPMYRVDTRCGFASELELVVETKKLVNAMAVSHIVEIPVVSGGAIAPVGTIVVDSINKPSQVIGVADGFGGILPEIKEVQYQDKIQKVKGGIIADRLHTYR